MKNVVYILVSGLLLTWIACSEPEYGNPAAEDFNVEASDEKAIAIADEVMEAMGGRQAWDETRYLVWDFFGSRKHYWDKQTGDVRIESIRDNYTVLMNINTMEGKVKMDSIELSKTDSLGKYLQKGMEAWINDSYWLVMPFKLKDSGVTLKYKGEGNTEQGEDSDILELTFNEVGVTPQNKYDVYVDKNTRLVKQWAFYPNYEDSEARFITPWDGYKMYGKIQLSGGRGKYELTEIDAPASLPAELFSEF